LIPKVCTRAFFLASAAAQIRGRGKPAFIYRLGDYEPSREDTAITTEKRLHKLAPEAEIHVEQLAVTPQQIGDWGLPTQPTKRTYSRAKKIKNVELDSISPDSLRALVRDAIERHLSPSELDTLKVAEESDRQAFTGLYEMWTCSAKGKSHPL